MERLLLALLLVGALAKDCPAQVGEIYSIGHAAAEGMSDHKRNKVLREHLVRTFVFDDSLWVLRVPADLIKSPARDAIISVQNALAQAHADLKHDKPVLITHVESDIQLIAGTDSKWDVLHYQQELERYEAYMDHRADLERERMVREYDRRDSLRRVEEAAERRREDSVQTVRDARYAILLHQQDSLSRAQEAQRLREVQLNDTAPPAEAPQHRSSSSPSYGTSRTSGNERTYYTGPRGGCYYYNSHGNKTYVDHSYCR